MVVVENRRRVRHRDVLKSRDECREGALVTALRGADGRDEWLARRHALRTGMGNPTSDHGRQIDPSKDDLV
jgi:hypothetical protein